jgi:hypothetical protein
MLWGWQMPSMRAVLEARRKAAVVRVEELEAELERVRTDLADAEEVLGRRVIGLEQYLEALAEEEAPAVVVGGSSQRKPVGPRRAVPHRENAAGVEDLSVDYQAVMAAATEAEADGLDARRTARGARLGQCVRLPRRGCESTSEEAGGTGLAAVGRRVRAASRSVVDAGVASTSSRSPRLIRTAPSTYKITLSDALTPPPSS